MITEPNDIRQKELEKKANTLLPRYVWEKIKKLEEFRDQYGELIESIENEKDEVIYNTLKDLIPSFQLVYDRLNVHIAELSLNENREEQFPFTYFERDLINTASHPIKIRSMQYLNMHSRLKKIAEILDSFTFLMTMSDPIFARGCLNELAGNQ